MANSGSDFFELKDSPGKGMGLFAKKKIPRGQLVIAEKPLFAVSAPLFFNIEKIERDCLSKLNPKEKQSFYELKDAFSPSKPSFIGILHTNSLPLGVNSTTGGIFPLISRINHSCVLNVKHSWNSLEKMEKIYAIKDIEQGEEILTSYLEIYQTKANRQRNLKEKFNFECSCPACSLVDPKLEQESDRRRLTISQLDELVPIQANVQPLAAMRRLDKLLELLKEEGMEYDAASIARASYDYFSLLYQTGMTRHLGLWARRTITNRIICEGPNSDAFLQARFKNELLRYYNPHKVSKRT